MATRRIFYDRVLRYDNFSKGEYGLLGPENAPPGSYSGKNVITYANGFIGPRPGLKNITPQNQPNGVLKGFAPTPTPGKDGIFIIGTTAYRFNLFDPSGDTPVAIGSVPNSSGEVVYPKLSTTTNIATTVTEGAVEINQITDTVTDLTSPSGHAHTVYGDQLILAENTSSRKIFASALGNFADWSGAFSFDIGDFWQVTALETQRNNLIIFKRTGIYVASGGPLDNTNTGIIIRKVLGIDGVLHPWQVVPDSQDSLWFFEFNRAYPTVFTGSSVTSFGHLQFSTKEEDSTAATPPVKRSVVNLQGQLTPDTHCFIQGGAAQEMLLQHNGIWSYHKFEAPITAMARGAENNLVITDGGGVSTPAKFYSTRFDIDRPAFTSDGLFSPGDGSNTPLSAEFTLPHFYEGQGIDTRVRAVAVEVKKWNTGVTTNSLTVGVTTLNRINNAGDVVNAGYAWAEAATQATTAGIHDRLTFPLLCAKGEGFQIKLSNIVGIAIRGIEVLYEIDPEQPRIKSE